MSINNWIVHPLALLSSSSNPISTIEQRQYLYDQERNLEKIVRYQWDLSSSISDFVKSRENQIRLILDNQSLQNSNQLEFMQNLWYWISNWFSNVIEVIQQMDENQMEIFRLELKALWIIDSTLNEWFTVLSNDVNKWFSELLDATYGQTVILSDISSKLSEVIHVLRNPRKIEWLEYKRDWIDYLRNKWYKESLEYLYLSADKLTSDQEVFYLIWIIEFEENKDYDNAILSFEKAIKYSKWYDDIKIYTQSLDKISSILFIKYWQEWNLLEIKKAYEYQLEAVKISPKLNLNYTYDLLKYSAILWEYDTFEIYIYILLKENISLVFEIFSNDVIIKDRNIISLINKAINRIKDEEFKRKEKEENDKYLRKLNEEKKYISDLKNNIKYLESQNWVEWYLQYIDWWVIVIWNKYWQITDFLIYSKDFTSVKWLRSDYFQGKWFKYVKNFGNDKNSLYSLSDLYNINWEKKWKLLILDSMLVVYCNIEGKLHISYDINDWDKSVYFWDYNKKIYEWWISKCILNNNSKVSPKSNLELLKLGDRINFLRPDWKPLLYLEVYSKLEEKFKEINEYVNNRLFEEFNSNWKWRISILNEVYDIVRTKNMYWYYDYEIDFN